MSDLFGTDLFSEFDRLQRQISNLFGNFPSSLLASRSRAFPPVNIGATNNSIEIVAFVPGINAEELDMSIDKGLLTINGQRKPALPDTSDDTRAYSQEVFAGAFRRSWSCSGARQEWLFVDRQRMTITPAVDSLAPWTGMGTCAAEEAQDGAETAPEAQSESVDVEMVPVQ